MDAYNGPIRESHSWHRDGCEHTRTRTVSRPASTWGGSTNTNTNANANTSTVHAEEVRHDIHNAAQKQHHVQLKSQHVRVRYDGLLVHIQWHTAFERAVKPTPHDDTDSGSIIAQESWHNELTLDLRPLLDGSGAPIDSIPISLPTTHSPSPSPSTTASNINTSTNTGNVAPSFASTFAPHAHPHPPVPLMLTAAAATAAHPRHRKPASQPTKPAPAFIVEEISSEEEPDRPRPMSHDSPDDLSDQDALFVSQRAATSTRRPGNHPSSHRRPPHSSTRKSSEKRSRHTPAIDTDALYQRIASLEQQLSEKKRHDGQDGGREKSRKRGGAREKRRKTATWASDSE
ncbi:hypothetical protein AC578_7065 [Pseudocercospora eumusae]|uniref:Uncharacterized protein n=1 Tax=Pseudocercospora eumusae TaxID=321146 RepID=A0A139HFP9_9PEZI|nr:hypothetical protein AC578_7065 [Pseudocercospora eumusae]